MDRKESKKRSVGKVIQKERIDKGVSLRKLASVAGVSPSYLSKIENNVMPPPSADKIGAIAKVLDLNADKLISLSNKIPSDVVSIIRRKPIECFNLLRRSKNEPELFAKN